jgi:Ca2+-binding RTX toxin-like protein
VLAGAQKLWPVLAAALALLVLGASSASAQEAPICTKWKDHLKPGDNFHLGDGNASVIGPESSDHIFGEGGKDLINGGRGNDVIEGGPGNDILCGGRGNDTIIGGDGNDHIFGGRRQD